MQMLERMVAFEDSGRSAPDADPIPDVARRLLRDTVSCVGENHSRQELAHAARILAEMLDAVSDNLFFVDSDFDDGDGDHDGRGGGETGGGHELGGHG